MARREERLMPNASSMVTIGALLLGAFAMVVSAQPLPPDVQAALQSQKQIWVATRRADGSRSEAAPIWFWSDGRLLYFSTGPETHKAKRIQRGSPIYFSLAGKDGPFFEGTPEQVSDLQLVERLGNEYSKKYWIAWLGLFRPRAARVSSGKTVVVKVTPKN
jgi:general stress protein 26